MTGTILSDLPNILILFYPICITLILYVQYYINTYNSIISIVLKKSNKVKQCAQVHTVSSICGIWTHIVWIGVCALNHQTGEEWGSLW